MCMRVCRSLSGKLVKTSGYLGTGRTNTTLKNEKLYPVILIINAEDLK